MAFPTGNSISGVKSDIGGGSQYDYYTGVQPNGTPSIGNWNTGGSYAGTGNASGVYDPYGNMIGGSPNLGQNLADGGSLFYPSNLVRSDPEPSFGSLAPSTYQTGPIPPALGPQGLPNVQIPLKPGTPAPRTTPLSMPPGYAGHANHPTWGGPRTPRYGSIGTAPRGSYGPNQGYGPGFNNPFGGGAYNGSYDGATPANMAGFSPAGGGPRTGSGYPGNPGYTGW